MSKAKSSYQQILNSSAIIGGSQIVRLVLGFIHLKAAALLLGTTGLGIYGNLSAIQNLAVSLTSLGVPGAAVRDLSIAHDSQQTRRLENVISALKSTLWLGGTLAFAVLAFFGQRFSILCFGNAGLSSAFAFLGLAVLLLNISSGHLSYFQGLRKTEKIAKIYILTSLASVMLSIPSYYLFGYSGIALGLALSAATQLTTTSFLSSEYRASKSPIPLASLLNTVIPLARLGFVLMWTSFLVTIVAFLTRLIITNQLGLEACGIFTAAFSLSGSLLNFVLSAMSTDYYPRLSAASHDCHLANNYVNEQTEIGILLATPGLIATIGFAPWAISIFFSNEFLPATSLIHWLALGCMGRVISWPLGYLILAMGESKVYWCLETAINLLHLALTCIGLFFFKLEGVAIAFFMLYVVYSIVVFLIARKLTSFKWSTHSKKTFLATIPLIVVTFLIAKMLPPELMTPATAILLCLSLVIGVREAMKRLTIPN